ncbi:MAG TPA: transcriptional regulator [Candidatus Atribacteria bacterium]|nr:transcriptional regulator [Candidatus Atribacteria bacterium]
MNLEDRNGKYVLIITVQKSNVPISFNGRYYERVGNTTREMRNEKLKTFFLRKTNWDAIVNPDATFEEINTETVKKFIKLAKDKGRLAYLDENTDIEEIFEHLKLSIDEKLTNGAVILFAKDPQRYFLNAVLRVIRLKGETTIIGDRMISGNLFNQVFQGEEAIKQFLNVRYEIKEIVRKEIWDYPLEAIREGLVNALIHRDYFRWNVQTQVKIYDDYIWFYNIGGLPDGITLEQLNKPHPSVPRNPLLVHIFYLAGLIEEVGSGIGRIRDALNDAELPEAEFREEMEGFSVYFRKDIYTEEYLRKIRLNERQIEIVRFIKKHKTARLSSLKEVVPYVSEKTLYRDLQDLVRKGIIKQVGKKRGSKYVLL